MRASESKYATFRHCVTFASALVSVAMAPVCATGYELAGQIRYYSSALPVEATSVQLRGDTPTAAQTGGTGEFAFNRTD